MFTRTGRNGVLGTTTRTGTRNVYVPVLLNGRRHLRGVTTRRGVDLRKVRVIGLHRSHRARHHRHCTGVLSRGGTHRNIACTRTYRGVISHGTFNVVVITANSTSTFIANICDHCSRIAGVTRRVVNVHPSCARFNTLGVLAYGGNAFFVTSALVGHRPSARMLVSVTHLARSTIGFFTRRPIVTVLSCSGFNSSGRNDPLGIRSTVSCLRGGCPSVVMSKRVRIGFTLSGGLHSSVCPFGGLGNGSIGALVFPGLDSTGDTCGLLSALNVDRAVNPVRVNLGGPVRFASIRDSAHSVLGLAAITIMSTVMRRRVRGKRWLSWTWWGGDSRTLGFRHCFFTVYVHLSRRLPVLFSVFISRGYLNVAFVTAAAGRVARNTPLPLVLGFAFPLLLKGVLRRACSLISTTVIKGFLKVGSLTTVKTDASIMFLVLKFYGKYYYKFKVPITRGFKTESCGAVQQCIAIDLRLTTLVSVIVTILADMCYTSVLEDVRAPRGVFRKTCCCLLMAFVKMPYAFFCGLLSDVVHTLNSDGAPF